MALCIVGGDACEVQLGRAFKLLQQALPIVEVQILVGPQAVQAVGQQDRSRTGGGLAKGRPGHLRIERANLFLAQQGGLAIGQFTAVIDGIQTCRGAELGGIAQDPWVADIEVQLALLCQVINTGNARCRRVEAAVVGIADTCLRALWCQLLSETDAAETLLVGVLQHRRSLKLAA